MLRVIRLKCSESVRFFQSDTLTNLEMVCALDGVLCLVALDGTATTVAELSQSEQWSDLSNAAIAAA